MRKSLRLRNWEGPGFDPRALGAVVLSHAPIDHSGCLPILARSGFRGRVHCTRGTASLLAVVLRDAAQIQVEDAVRANRHGYSRSCSRGHPGARARRYLGRAIVRDWWHARDHLAFERPAEDGATVPLEGEG